MQPLQPKAASDRDKAARTQKARAYRPTCLRERTPSPLATLHESEASQRLSPVETKPEASKAAQSAKPAHTRDTLGQQPRRLQRLCDIRKKANHTITRRRPRPGERSGRLTTGTSTQAQSHIRAVAEARLRATWTSEVRPTPGAAGPAHTEQAGMPPAPSRGGASTPGAANFASKSKEGESTARAQAAKGSSDRASVPGDGSKTATGGSAVSAESTVDGKVPTEEQSKWLSKTKLF